MKRVYDRHSLMLDEHRVEARHQPLRAAATQRAIISHCPGAGRCAHRTRRAFAQATGCCLIWGDNDRDVPFAKGDT